jgi:hypothetical protein
LWEKVLVLHGAKRKDFKKRGQEGNFQNCGNLL